jgi:ABC-type glutathione transport system ATPase component
MSDTVLSVDGLVKRFAPRSTGFRRKAEGDGHLAVDNVSFSVGRGEVLGIAGASGSGKTTVARCLVRLVEPDAGTVDYAGADVLAARGDELRELRRRMQMIYQNPYSSLNPRMTVGDAILEAGRVHKRPGSERGDTFVEEFLDLVHLSSGTAQRYPRELSGGQRQRVVIARSLAVGPDFLIADEAVSALDVSVQAQLLNLLLELRDELGLSMLFISHQLAVLATIADRVAIMHLGRIVETGDTATVFSDPQHDYTRTLLAADPPSVPVPVEVE